MAGTGRFSSASSSNGGAWAPAGGRRVSKLGALGPNSKRRRPRRSLLQFAKRRVLRYALVFSVLLIFGLAVHNGSFFGVPVPAGEKAKAGATGWRPSAGGNSSYPGGVGEAHTDITTKALYDEIEFKNEEGGVWRQGWNVQYQGHEWDAEKLKVFVVPHSHNDPGWIRTVEEYYVEKSRSILTTVVQSLKKDKRRKFIWEEISFLERWWQDASATEKEDLKGLVRAGQLEIVGGGWVMNDEANSHFYAVIQQMIAGNLWLRDNIGFSVKNAWAIDPFGYSPTMAYLLQRMGFKNMLIQRTHYEVKKALARKTNLEFMWRQSWDDANTTDIFCHMMPFYSYDIPHTCGPEPAVCCQFDYWRLPGAHGADLCPWGKNPVEITPQNVKERAELLLDQYRKKSTLYRSNTLLVPLGDDFRFVTMQEAEAQFTNLQKIFEYINSQPYLRASVQFGTLEDYFATLRAEASSDPTGDHVPGYPTLSGDFFTYADRDHDYWSGYFVSRPFYKAIDRVLEETLRGADILFTLAVAYCHAERSEFPLTSTSTLVSARRNLALFQHHDGVTGTAKYHVVADYGERMHVSLLNLLGLMADMVTTILSRRTPSAKCRSPTAEGNQVYEPEQTRAKYDMLPVKTVVKGTGDQVRRVVLFNSLQENLEQVFTILVEDPLMCVFDSAWKPVPSQVSPEWDIGIVGGPSTGKHRLQWQAKVPPMALQTYIVAHSATAESCIRATIASLEILNMPATFVCPKGYECVSKRDTHVKITNTYQTLVFGGHNGLLQRMEVEDGGANIAVEEELAFYSSQGSGAYLFAPNGEAKSFVEPGGLILVSKGPLMEEVYTIPKCNLAALPVVRSARLYTGNSVQAGIAEMEYRTQLGQHVFNDKELIARFKTELNNKGVFYSDLNGFQMARRETLDKIPLQGNYYPMPSLAFIQCPGGRRFSIHSRQALGVASLGKGWLEVMLDRRLSNDDGRGLGHGVMDNRQNSVVFHLLIEKNVSPVPALELSSSSRVPSLLSHRAGAQLDHPLHGFLGKREDRAQIEESSVGFDPFHKMAFSPFPTDVPCDLHVVAMQVLDATGIKPLSKQKVALLLQRRGLDPSYGLKKDLNGIENCSVSDNVAQPVHTLLQNLGVSGVRLTSLNLLHDEEPESDGILQQVHRKQQMGSAKLEKSTLQELSPMEIKGYKFALTPKE